jgi:K+-transporting ATPase ATPase C chain
MNKEIATQLRLSLVYTAVFTVLLGLAYPVAVTLMGKALFPKQAGGSFITVDGKRLGSRLVGQPFGDPGYFWGRPSATAPYACNSLASSGSNLGPLNPDLARSVQSRVEALRAADPGNADPVPMDLVTASGSGLDPHISPASATYQAPRVARARRMDVQRLLDLVTRHMEGRTLGFLGDPRVNVLELNLDLDGMAARP